MTPYAKLFSRARVGVEAPEIQIEVQLANGLPSLTLVGLPEASVKESRDRVRSALLSSGFTLPAKRITLNLAPAELPKQGSRYDLAIALGMLAASGQLMAQRDLLSFEFFGELTLNGDLRPVTGLLPALLAAKSASTQARVLIVPEANLAEAGLVSGIKVLGAAHLLEVVDYLRDELATLSEVSSLQVESHYYESDLSDIRGQYQAKRLLEVCAAGHHSLLMIGPPGSGKSMLAQRLITLLPPLSESQALEVAALESISGQLLTPDRFFQRRLIQSHHTATVAAMVGGGSSVANVKPGAVSLAHHGVLFLDELPEFNRPVLEALREPLETKQVEVSRLHHHVTFPADTLLVAAMNPSPSGYFADDPLGRCLDTPQQIARYRRKISGPLLDRVDCHLEVAAVDYQALSQLQEEGAETSDVVRQRVENVRARQWSRQGCLNGQLSVAQLQDYLQQHPLGAAAEKMIAQAVDKLGLSARAYHRIIRLALTLADMAQSDQIEIPHLAEAISYRSFDQANR